MKKLVQRTCVIISALTLLALMLAGCGGSGGGAADNGSVGTPLGGENTASGLGTPATGASVAKQLTLAWDPVVGATSYNLYWSTTPDVSPASGNRINVVGNSYVHTGLAAGTTYYYVVTATDSTTESAASAPASKTTAL